MMPAAAGMRIFRAPGEEEPRHGRDPAPGELEVEGIPAGEARLTGFGIASRLPRERQTLEPPETIAGTLASRWASTTRPTGS